MSDPFLGLGTPVESVKPTPRINDDPFLGLGTPVPTPDPFMGLGTPVTPENTYTEQRKEVAADPWFGRQGKQLPTTPEDIDAIAAKYGVDSAKLKEAAPYLGAYDPEKLSLSEAVRDPGRVIPESLKVAASSVIGEGIGLGLPQKLGILGTNDPKMQAALDDLRQLAQSRKGSITKVAEIVTPSIPFGNLARKGGAAYKGSKALATAAEMAAVGGVAGAAQSRTGEELEGAGVGALFGAGLGGGIGGLGKVIRGTADWLHPEWQKKLGERLEKDAPDVDTAVQAARAASKAEDQIVEQAIRTGDTTPILSKFDPENISPEQSKLLAFLQEEKVPVGKLTPDEISAELQKLQSAQGPDFLVQKFNNYLDEQAALNAVQESAFKLTDPTWRPIRYVAQWLSGIHPIARSIDERLGTDVDRTIRNISEGLNRLTFIKKVADDKRNTLTREMRSTGISPTDVTKALEKPDFRASLPDNQQAVVQKWEQHLTTAPDSLLNQLRAGFGKDAPGVPIRTLDNYATHSVIDTPEYIDLVNNLSERANKEIAAREIGTDLSRLGEDAFLMEVTKGGSPAQKLHFALEFLTDAKITTPDEFRAAVQKAKSPREVESLLQERAKASWERQGNIPDFLREKNILRLHDKYIAGNFKYIALRNSLDRLERSVNVIRAAGDKLTADRLSTLLTDMAGTRSTALASLPKVVTDRIRVAALAKERRATSETAKAFWKTVGDAPEFMLGMTNNIYPAFLGLNARATLRNLMGIPSMVGPTLGGGSYAYKVSFQGMAQALANPGKLLADLESRGLSPASPNAAAREALAEGIRSSLPGRVGAETVSRMNYALMYLYGKADTYNRIGTAAVAENLARHLLEPSNANHAAALRSLGTMPLQIQRRVMEGIKSNDMRKVYEELSSHLIAATQFHYNKASMSEFGRTMGPLLSTFTKWPTEIAGDIYQQMETRGLYAGSRVAARKFLAPLVAMAGVQHILFGKPEDMDPRRKNLVGSGGLMEAMPGYSLTGLSDLGRPPVVDTLGALFMAPITLAKTRDLDQFQTDLLKASAKAGEAYIPGAGVTRLLFRDIPAIFYNERPKTLSEGADILTR